MYMFPGYRVREVVSEGRQTVLLRAVQTNGQRAVLIKAPCEGYATPFILNRLQQEHKITKDLTLDRIVSFMDLEITSDSLFLVADDVPCITLRNFLVTGRLNMYTFLKMALQLAEIVGELHQHHITHHHLHPDSILVSPSGERVYVTEFSYAESSLTAAVPAMAAGLPGVDLAYLSPEQTGRMNRIADYRSDFYSLGIVYYEMLTGKTPFQLDEPLEWIHAHIAKNPQSPHRIEQTIPVQLSAIVMKLLAKSPEERYQSAYGLMSDLNTCLKQWEMNGEIRLFSPGRKDVPAALHIAGHCYGREQEYQQILSSFRRACSGSLEMIIVSGRSGIGKSTFVNNVSREFIAEGAYYISGKFEVLTRDIPYLPLIKAFRELIYCFLAKQNNIEAASCINRIVNALQGQGRIIAEVIPEIELLIGPTPSVEQLPPKEAKNRFQNVFRNFVKALPSASHPLVIFMDDLQWADSASLSFIQHIMTASDNQNLLFIGAVREEEMNEKHSALLAIEEIRQNDVPVYFIPLQPLNRNDLAKWLADTLVCEKDFAFPLASVLYKKTFGNPFFFQQLLKAIYQAKRLYFVADKGEWNWDLAGIEQLSISDNVVEWMIGTIQQMPGETQEILYVAACLGNSCEVYLLAGIVEKSADELLECLREAFLRGILVLSEGASEDTGPGSFRFLHDQVWQSVYSLPSREKKQAVHLRIGRYLLVNNTCEENQSDSYRIVRHLNLCGPLLIDPEERKIAAELNLAAGLKAKAAIAYEQALQYFMEGLNWIGEVRWDEEYPLTFLLTFHTGECQYLTGDFAEAEVTATMLLRKTRTKEERIQVYQLLVRIYLSSSYHCKSITAGLQALESIGFSLKLKPSKVEILVELLKVKGKRLLREKEGLKKLPAMQEKNDDLVMQILHAMGASAFFISPEFFGLYVLRMFRYVLEHGNHWAAPQAYANYALFLSGGFGQFEEAYEFGSVALSLADEQQHDYIRGSVHFIFGAFMSQWKEYIGVTIGYIEQAILLANRAGDLYVSSASYAFLVIFRQLKGDPLADVLQSVDQSMRLIKDKNVQLFTDFLLFFQDNLQKLTTIQPEHEVDNLFDCRKFMEQYAVDDTTVIVHATFRMQRLYLMGNYELALQTAQEVEPLIKDKIVLMVVPEYYFYYAMTLARFCHGKKRRQETWKKLKNIQGRMKRWSVSCPDNFLHKYLLILAEMAAVQGDMDKAVSSCERAAEQARCHGFQQDEAIACERAGIFYGQTGDKEKSKRSLEDAYLLYMRWGAQAKAAQIKNKYLTHEHHKETEREKLDITFPVHLDMATVMKALQALSEEIMLEQLLVKLMNISLENANATRAVLILQQEDSLFLEAEAAVDEDQIKVFIPPAAQALPLCEELPNMVIHYVYQTKSHFVRADLAGDLLFINDPYVKKARPKSVMCLPVLYQGRTTGVLYLENNLSTGVFTDERVQLLNILSVQMAISIENARLYSQMRNLNLLLEEKVRERTLSVEKTMMEISETKVEMSVLEERNRIAREIHDIVGHTMTTTIVQLEAGKRLMEKDPQLAMEKMELSQDLIRQGLSEIRKSVRMLQEEEFPNGLLPSLRKLIRETETNAGVIIKADVMDVPILPFAYNKAIYHALQEGLTNGIRHGHSTYFEFSLKQEDETIRFVLEDNGEGTDQITPGFGLTSMKERIEALRGHLSVTGEWKQGCRIELNLSYPVKHVLERSGV